MENSSGYAGVDQSPSKSPNELTSSNDGDECMDETGQKVTGATQKRTNRNSRTGRACEGCRKKKIACDGRQPCRACSTRKRDCVYTTLTVTGRPSKGAVKLLQRQIETLEAENEALRSGKQIKSQSTSQLDGSNGTKTDGPALPLPYGPSGEPTGHRDSINSDTDDFFFLTKNINQSLTISQKHANEHGGKNGNLFDLHTSFRLERQENGDFTTSLGWCMAAIQLGQTMMGKNHNVFSNRSGSVDAIQQQVCAPNRSGNQNNLLVEPFSAANIPLYWPSREREEQLFNVYFRLVQPSWPILCKDTLKVQRTGSLRNIFQNDPVWLSIMLGLFIAAGRYVPSEHENLQLWWTARMQLGAHDLVHCSSIGGIQNLLMTVNVRSCLLIRTHIDWVAAGMVLRTMQDRGLHREAVLKTLQHDAAYTGLIRCLWWTAQKADIDMCARWGRTPAAVSFDVMPPRGSSLSSPVPYFIASLRGLRLTAQVLDVRYLHDATLRDNVLVEVKRWLAELKEYFPFMPKERDDEKIFANAKLSMFAYSVVALAFKSNINVVFKTLERQQSSSEGKKAREMTEKELADYEKAKVVVKEITQNTAKIIKSLIDRSRQDVQFFDDDIVVHAGSVLVIANFLCYAEKLKGVTDEALLQSITTISDILSNCTFGGTVTASAKEFCRTMTSQLTKRMRDHESLYNQPQNSNEAAQINNFPQQNQPNFRFDPSTYSPGVPSSGNMVLVPEQGPTDIQNTFRSAINIMDRYASDPRVLMDNAQYARASPDSKLWDDVLHNEIMLLDGITNTTAGFPHNPMQYSIPASQPSGNDTTQNHSTSEYSAGEKRMIDQNIMEDQAYQPPSNQYFGNVGMRRGSAQVPILSSMWLGPDMEHTLPPLASPVQQNGQALQATEKQGDLSVRGNDSSMPRFNVPNIFSTMNTTAQQSTQQQQTQAPVNTPISALSVSSTEEVTTFSNPFNGYKIPNFSPRNSGLPTAATHGPFIADF